MDRDSQIHRQTRYNKYKKDIHNESVQRQKQGNNSKQIGLDKGRQIQRQTDSKTKNTQAETKQRDGHQEQTGKMKRQVEKKNRQLWMETDRQRET